MSTIKITKNNFEQEVINSAVPVLVDFWASWCGPCRMVAPVLEDVANERTDIKVGKINIDEEPSLAERYGIMSIPTMLVFKNGKVSAKSVGAIPKESVIALLSK